MPAAELMCYASGELLGLKADNGLLTLPECWVTASVSAERDGEAGQLPCSEAVRLRVGLFKNKVLTAWLDPGQKPENFHGDFEGESFFCLPAGMRVTLSSPADELCFAAVVTDEYGREAVYTDIPYVLEGGSLTWPDDVDLSDSDPAHWQYPA